MDYHINLLISKAYYGLEDIKFSKVWVEKAYQLNSWEPRIQYHRALLEHDSGNPTKAIEYL